MIPLCLASASPARATTLTRAGIQPMIRVSEVDEPVVLAEAEERFGVLEAEDVALFLARAKCENVASALDEEEWSGLVIGCDSVLELDGQVHGKPASPQEAVQRWLAMSGKSGVLHTGHWLVDLRHHAESGSGATIGAVASTTVHFAQLSRDEIESYVATGEPMHAAGAFTIDGLGGAFVERIDGDHHNVVGISLPLLRSLARQAGVGWFDLTSLSSR
nr:Maf family protein [Gephyromycinifex aptenodytis]